MTTFASTNLFRWSDPECWSIFDQQEVGHSADDILLCLENQFAGLALFHACRPASEDSYREDGIRYLTRLRLEAYTEELFLHLPHAPELLVLRKAIRETVSGAIGICLAVDERIIRGSHFHEFGSEFCLRVAMALQESTGIDYKSQLRSAGRPLLVTVAMNWGNVSGKDEIAWRINETRRLEIRPIRTVPQTEICMVFEHPIGADRIVAMDRA
jgi:hypothetical protein